ncbi:MAG: fumarylacetoacetate hydrolase family protein [Steroidobacteraceae bacterium]|nr:fumarylacetoacetate hydrolase family protein [Steroidobacteraceae bacterium]
MQLVTYRPASAGPPKLGAQLADGAVLDLAAAAGGASAFESMLALIEAGPEAWEEARGLVRNPRGSAVHGAGTYALLAPMQSPPQIRDFMCFEKHVIQAFGAAFRMRATRAATPEERAALLAQADGYRPPPVWYERPLYYKANRFSISGPGDTIRWPAYSRLMDYECELACVIGRPGADIPSARAREHVFGWTIFNDFSARDAQGAEMAGGLGPAKGKDFDGANAFGPCIVTADEIPDPYGLEMIVRVNGEERSRGSSRDMHWKFGDLIAYVSQGETLHAGEILGSGTVGDGCGLEQLRFLEDGDLVEVEIPPIGVLANRVVRGGKPA